MTTASRRAARWSAGLLVAALATGCTSSGGGGPSSSVASGSRPAGPTGSATGSPVRPSGSVTTPESTGTPASPSTKAQIAAAYRAFFDSRSSTAQSQAALQNGPAFHAVLVQQAKNAHAAGSGVKVGDVSVNGDLGFVTYTITQNGSPLLANAKGYAIRQGGRWKVAAITFCTLMQLQGGMPVVCNNPSVTALPR